MIDITNLAAITVATLTPYFVKGAEEFAKEAGKSIFSETKKIKDWLWNKITQSKDKTLRQTSDLFESQPEVFKEAMEKMLTAFLESHPDVAQELAEKLQKVENSNKYQLNIQGGTNFGVVQGDNAHFEQKIIQDKDRPTLK